MAVSESDINFTFSGGSTNTDPDKSLGGEPSLQPIMNKRLFDDVTDDETKNGVRDYRCFYLHNENNVDTLFNSYIYVTYADVGETSVELGFNFENERQNITISNGNTVTGGSFTLVYISNNNSEILVNWDSDLSVWANNLQTALREIDNLGDVVVSAFQNNNAVVFEVDFLGLAANRFHELLVLDQDGNNLISVSPTTIGVVKTVNGGPINKISDVIDVDTTPPNTVVFSSSPVLVGDLRPLDSIPIWVKRIVPANSTPMEHDGFILNVKGDLV